MNDKGCICLVTVDGIDFEINEPGPFHKRWYSHKSNGPGLRYEIGICIQTGWIVWRNGPFACGDWADLSIARYAITERLGRGEKYLADGGYRSQDGNAETPTYLDNPDQKMKQDIHARHEAINGMVKRFEALNRTFRHSRDAHQAIFNAVLNLVQANIKLEGPPFHKPYDDGRRRRR